MVGPPGLELVLTTQALHSQMQPSYNINFIPVDTEAHAVVYEDSQGMQHTLEYRVMGNGCSNG